MGKYLRVRLNRKIILITIIKSFICFYFLYLIESTNIPTGPAGLSGLCLPRDPRGQEAGVGGAVKAAEMGSWLPGFCPGSGGGLCCVGYVHLCGAQLHHLQNEDIGHEMRAWQTMSQWPEPALCLSQQIKFYWHTGPPFASVLSGLLSHDNGRAEQLRQTVWPTEPKIFPSGS